MTLEYPTTEYPTADAMRTNYARIRSDFRARTEPLPIAPVTRPSPPPPLPAFIPIDFMIGNRRSYNPTGCDTSGAPLQWLAPGTTPTFDQTEFAVCRYLNITRETLRLPSREHHICRPRMFAQFIAKIVGLKSHHYIANRYKVDHSSIVNAVYRMKIMVETDAKWREAYRVVRAQLGVREADA